MLNELEDFDDAFQGQETTTVSMETPIPESNIGYKLLQKMGWQRGKGLGTQGQGRIDPIRIELKDDSLGVGKAEEYLSNHISSTSKRKATEIEKQLEETLLQKKEREHHVEKKQAIAKEISEVIRAFYCQLCDKQYKKVSEYEQHLQSYDHHHKKRFKDMKEAAKNSTINQSEREKKLARERKREEKELKRMQEAMQKKLGNTLQQPTTPKESTSTGQGGGGWAQVETVGQSNKGQESSGGGGWSQVETTIGSQNGAGGWSQVETISSSSSSGWTQSNTTVSSSDTSKQNDKIEPKNEELKAKPSSEPKKLSFGLKKTTGFQFGLKKK